MNHLVVDLMSRLKPHESERRLERFLQKLKFQDNVFLVFDKDVDGISSGVITLRAFEKMGIRISKTIPNFFDAKKFVDLKDFEAGIVVDVPTPLQENFLRKTKKKMLIIDHHPSRDVQSKNVFYINPRLANKEIYQPTSYVAYKLFSRFVDLRKEKWIAIMGTVGDYAFEDVKDLYKNHVKSKNKREIWKTQFGRAATRLNSAIAIYGPERSMEILKKSASFKTFFSNKKIEDAHKKFSKEFWSANVRVKKSSEFYPHLNLIFAQVSPKYNRISSALSSKISTEHPDSLVILAEKIGEKYKIHGRMQNGKMHVGDILRNFGGGGHRAAGACTIDSNDFVAFKRKLLLILEKK